MSSKPKPREAELNFEGAMDRLEKIVEQMESGKLPLEDLIVRYEEGMKLVKICRESRSTRIRAGAGSGSSRESSGRTRKHR
jgi:exodeoxyribonuclease VII small subunit